ncbi:MAG: hypothetical protein ACTH28_00320 [Brevibacterium aurantiacum]|uniref:Uncharacterized protein n=1 Tax=Brevibacterium aurantiacum TaxID=273384 RepID=A0A2A3ZAM4_BREAU|nr:hypothetical protein [Brevibacterium aurantiacum]PCC48521.1 hypothetical protein CIK62_18095 [Brevibacterium aurantiacum]
MFNKSGRFVSARFGGTSIMIDFGCADAEELHPLASVEEDGVFVDDVAREDRSAGSSAGTGLGFPERRRLTPGLPGQ